MVLGSGCGMTSPASTDVMFSLVSVHIQIPRAMLDKQRFDLPGYWCGFSHSHSVCFVYFESIIFFVSIQSLAVVYNDVSSVYRGERDG